MPMPDVIKKTFALSYGLSVTLKAQPAPSRRQEIIEIFHPKRPHTLSPSEQATLVSARAEIAAVIKQLLLEKGIESDCSSENRDATGQ